MNFEGSEGEDATHPPTINPHMHTLTFSNPVSLLSKKTLKGIEDVYKFSGSN